MSRFSKVKEDNPVVCGFRIFTFLYFGSIMLGIRFRGGDLLGYLIVPFEDNLSCL